MSKSVEQIVAFLKREIESASLGSRRAADIREVDAIMADLALDSLDYATVMLACEKWLGIHIDEAAADWPNMRTVGQLAAFLHGQQPHAAGARHAP